MIKLELNGARRGYKITIENKKFKNYLINNTTSSSSLCICSQLRHLQLLP